MNALLGAAGIIERDRPNLLVEAEKRHGQMPDVIALVLLDSGWVPPAGFDLVAHQRATVRELKPRLRRQGPAPRSPLYQLRPVHQQFLAGTVRARLSE
ncbi:hypothetical protein [Spirillospora sp. NPDC029432]|uniref:hypothetical protein n=1 Tax=Spirillospora sp. NPDC029432 TaxID=3154599 RepID=UPI003452FE0A